MENRESLKHRFAKEAVARWLRAEYPGPEFRVDVEYPFVIDANNHVQGACSDWGDGRWREACGDHEQVPSYQECLALELLPIAIFDVAVRCCGVVIAVYEIVHTNPVSPQKWQMIERIFARPIADVEFGTLDAHWVLAQVDRTDSLSWEGEFRGWARKRLA